MIYYVIKNSEGLYFRGKGVNKWGKFFNQASIYRVKGTAKASLEDVRRRDDKTAQLVPIKIEEIKEDAIL